MNESDPNNKSSGQDQPTPAPLLDELLQVLNTKDDRISELQHRLDQVRQAERASTSSTPTTIPARPPPVAPPLPVRPKQPVVRRQPEKTMTILERIAQKPLVKKYSATILTVVVLGLLCLGVCVTWVLTGVLASSVTWICNFTIPQQPVTAPAPPPDVKYPIDPHGSRMNPSEAFLYRIPPIENSALRRACMTPANFSIATSQLVSQGVSLDIQTERGLINMMSLRISLQQLALEKEYDFICSQLLDLPLCYCMAIIGSRPARTAWWLDVVGRLNITCVSKGTTIYSSVTDVSCPNALGTQLVKRFGTVCVEYNDMYGAKWTRTVSGIEAVIMQQIFEVHRGLNVCDSSLERTLQIMEEEAAAPISDVSPS